eukprot:4216510-Alexandrium_andersonii.AAC.1
MASLRSPRAKQPPHCSAKDVCAALLAGITQEQAESAANTSTLLRYNFKDRKMDKHAAETYQAVLEKLVEKNPCCIWTMSVLQEGLRQYDKVIGSPLAKIASTNHTHFRDQAYILKQLTMDLYKCKRNTVSGQRQPSWLLSILGKMSLVGSEHLAIADGEVGDSGACASSDVPMLPAKGSTA